MPRAAQECAQTDDGMPALVGHEEVLDRASAGKPLPIMVVSHCWESKQHADPYGHQLRQLVKKLQQPYAHDDCGSDIDEFKLLRHSRFNMDQKKQLDRQKELQHVWVFFDFCSLHQYKRAGSEVAAFGRAMANMHVLYSHEAAETVFIDKLTPTDVIEANKDGLVAVYDEESGMVKQTPASKLEANRTPYESRGWCSAEVQWSCTKGARSKSAIPLPPHVFAERFADGKGTGLKFTHRSDASEVLRLQAQVFNEKIPKCKVFEINLHVVTEDDLRDLADALPAFGSLKRLFLRKYKGEPVADVESVLLPALAKALVQVTCPNLEVTFRSWPRVEVGLGRLSDMTLAASLVLDQPTTDNRVLERALCEAFRKVDDAHCVHKFSGEVVRLSDYASGAA